MSVSVCLSVCACESVCACVYFHQILCLLCNDHAIFPHPFFQFKEKENVCERERETERREIVKSQSHVFSSILWESTHISKCTCIPRCA